jgi:hypothetical protein
MDKLKESVRNKITNIGGALPLILEYNLQILPESILSGVIILAIVLVSQPLIALAAGALFTQLLTSVVGKLLMKYMQGNAEMTATKCAEICNPGFAGKAWARLLNGGIDSELLWHPIAPSAYLAIIGYFVGVGWGLCLIYKEEIDANVVRAPSLIATSVISGILLLMAIVFRIYRGCDSAFGAFGGTMMGLLFGYLGTVTLGYVTNKRATNIWGIPLIRERCAIAFA